MNFIDLCIKAFKYFGCVFLIILAFAIVPYLLLIAIAIAFFMAVIGGAVLLLGTILSCFTGTDFNHKGIVKNIKGYVTKSRNAVASLFRRIHKQ